MLVDTITGYSVPITYAELKTALLLLNTEIKRRERSQNDGGAGNKLSRVPVYNGSNSD